jgi:hypothetical protein
MECTKCPFNKILCSASGCVLDIIAAHIIEVQKPDAQQLKHKIG